MRVPPDLFQTVKDCSTVIPRSSKNRGSGLNYCHDKAETPTTYVTYIMKRYNLHILCKAHDAKVTPVKYLVTRKTIHVKLIRCLPTLELMYTQ